MNVLKNCFLILSFIFFAASAKALTPQKYCETLPAVSCELLDVSTGGCTTNANACSVLIKYCKNQEFRVHPTAQYVTSSQSYYVNYRTAVGGSGTFGFGGGVTTKSNAELCTELP